MLDVDRPVGRVWWDSARERRVATRLGFGRGWWDEWGGILAATGAVMTD